MIGKYFEVYNKRTYRILTFSLLSLGLGGITGYLKSHHQAELANRNSGLQNLQQYESEDQINHTIDSTQKPAVIYYYQPGVNHHYIIRHAFIQCSNICKDNATFWMVNLTKKLQHAKQQIKMKFPLENVFMEIRFPKQDCQVKYDKDDVVQECTYRREFFKHQYYSGDGVQSFLQQNGIKQPNDPLQSFFRISKNSIFDDLHNYKANNSQ